MAVIGEQIPPQSPVAAPALELVPAAGGLGVADFDAVFRASWGRMVRLAVLLLGDVAAAEDVVQDAFANTYRRWSSMTDSAGAAAYIRVAVVNGCRSALRRRRLAAVTAPLHSDTAVLQGEGWTDGADSALLVADDRREVLAALAKLPRRQRELLILRYWEGLSEAELAVAMNISRGTVKSTASRALASLTKKLERPGGH